MLALLLTLAVFAELDASAPVVNDGGAEPGPSAASAPAPSAGIDAGNPTEAARRANLLFGAAVSSKPPRDGDRAKELNRLADGVINAQGENWVSPMSVVIENNGYIEWDLGAPKPIAAALVQADNNEEYDVSGSLDGKAFGVFWTASASSLPGMQTRSTKQLSSVMARYVRLSARGGDGRYSASELALYSTPEALEQFPPTVSELPRPEAQLDTAWLVNIAFAAFVVWLLRPKKASSAVPESPAKPPA